MKEITKKRNAGTEALLFTLQERRGARRGEINQQRNVGLLSFYEVIGVVVEQDVSVGLV